MQENNKKTKLILRIFAFTLALTLTLSIGVFSLNSKVDKVQASSTPAIIDYTDYNIGLGQWYSFELTYDYEIPYDIITMFGEPMLHISRPENMPNIDLLEYCNVSMSLNTLVTLEDGEKHVESKIYNFDTAHNSQRYRYFINNVSIPYVSFGYSDDGYMNIPEFGVYPISNIEINIPRKWSSASSLYNQSLVSRYLYYKTDLDESKLNIVYSYDNGSFATDPVMSVYLTFEGDYASSIIGRYLYNYSVFRVDRSEYIKYVDRVVEKPVYEFTPLNAIKDGVNSFLGIKVLPNFTIGNFLALALGISFFGFLLHLIIK